MGKNKKCFINLSIVLFWIICLAVSCSREPNGNNGGNSSSSSGTTTTNFVFSACVTNSLGTNGSSVMTNTVFDFPPTYYSNFIITNDAYPYEITVISNALTNGVYLFSITNFSWFTNYGPGITNFLNVINVAYTVLFTTNAYSTNAAGYGLFAITNGCVASNFAFTNYAVTNRVSEISNRSTNTIIVYASTNYSYYLSASYAATNWLSNSYSLYTNNAVVYSYIGNAWKVLTNDNAGGSITILSSIYGFPVTGIGLNAFSYCSNLLNITIPDSVIDILYGAFSYCTNLTNAIIPDSVTNIGSYAFNNCRGLKNVIIPNGVAVINSYVFYSCDYLTNVTIPNSVKEIGDYAFAYCYGLNIVIPNSVISIGNHAFDHTGLKSMDIPDGVITIGEWAFTSSINLTNVIIPNSVTGIMNFAFDSCNGLKSVVVNAASPPAVGETIFRYCGTFTLSLPSASYTAYTNAGWTPLNLGDTNIIMAAH